MNLVKAKNRRDAEIDSRHFHSDDGRGEIWGEEEPLVEERSGIIGDPVYSGLKGRRRP